MTTLITGATGKTGLRVAHRLQALDRDVRAVTRHSTPRFDWHDQTTWSEAVDGCASAYLTFQPDLGLPGADEIIGAFAAQAVAAGCSRLVLLSGRGEDGAQRAEQAMTASGAEWTILRSAFFLQNFTEGAFADELAAGSLSMVEHTVAEPFVDAADIADVAVAVLLDKEYVGRVLELTGPQLLTFEEAAHAIGGPAVAYQPVPTEDYIAVLTAAGLPAADAAGLAYLFEEVLDGRNAYVTGDVESVLGRAARSIDDLDRGEQS
ncbi:NmrA family transcriptional regulator [Nocardioides sp. NPDC051685]|uniref:NmrA family transcriptional regulator n=1 Tax=Nocardioides sp. NPDC051685 TaxID=3364334 RepID=UPI003788C9EA